MHRQSPRSSTIHNAINFSPPLDKLQTQASTNMPGNMTMHQPDSRIIRRESQHEIASRGHRGGISSRGIVELEGGEVSVPG